MTISTIELGDTTIKFGDTKKRGEGMTEREKVKLASKAIRSYAQEHWGWGAKFHPDQEDKYNACMEIADKLERGKPLNCSAPIAVRN